MKHKQLFSKMEIIAIIVVLIIIAVMIAMSFSFKEKQSYSLNMFYMDTYINIKIYEKNDKVLDQVENLFKTYNELTDPYNAYEGLVNVYYLNNTLEQNKPIKIDRRLYKLIEYAKAYNDKTDGNLNIALGNVISVWKQYRDGAKEGVPTLSELQHSGSVSIDDIILKDGYYERTSNVKIDLGAVAKGYTSQLVADLLEENGITKYLINSGGNVVVGDHYNYSTYKIGVTDPLDKEKEFIVLRVKNKAVVTSGSYERYYTYKDKTYSHIIDPNTLFPPTNDIASVTVITDDSGYADIMSTYLFVVGYDKGLNYINNHSNIEAIWYMNDGTIKYSNGAKDYVEE